MARADTKGRGLGVKHELNTGHEVVGQWPIDSLFQCLFFTFLCFFVKKVHDMNECTWRVCVHLCHHPHLRSSHYDAPCRVTHNANHLPSSATDSKFDTLKDAQTHK